MTEPYRPRAKYVIGPDGSPLTIADLPPSNTRRWVIRRKAEVVAAVRGGLLSLEEACNRYTLTVEEFLSWQASIDEHGLAGLRTTRIQQYRHSINALARPNQAPASQPALFFCAQAPNVNSLLTVTRAIFAEPLLRGAAWPGMGCAAWAALRSC